MNIHTQPSRHQRIRVRQLRPLILQRRQGAGATRALAQNGRARESRQIHPQQPFYKQTRYSGYDLQFAIYQGRGGGRTGKGRWFAEVAAMPAAEGPEESRLLSQPRLEHAGGSR